MIGLLWNCRGIRKKGVAPFIRNLIGLHKFKFIGLQETMVVEGDDSITKKLDPSNDYLWLWSPSNGKSGGILVGSRIDDLDVGSFKQGKHVLQVNYWDKSALCKWNLMVVYGPAHEENKDNFLDELETFCVNSKEPYIVGGDFNIIRFTHEKNKENTIHHHSDLFNWVIQKCCLREIHMVGGGYTWSNNHETHFG